MALYKREKTWWVRFTHNGQRIQRSTGTTDKTTAQKYHDKLKADLWTAEKLSEKPFFTWRDAVIRWIEESQHKRSIETDKIHLRWIDKHLRYNPLHEITRDTIERVALTKEAEGVKPATINRILEIIRAILRKAEKEWEWIDKAPTIRMRYENTRRIRWLSPAEAQRLIAELPPRLAEMAAFTLATGLRAANVLELQWQDVNLDQGHAWIHPDQAKANKAIAVPLNTDAMHILKKRLGVHPEHVFTYKGKPIGKCNTKAWRKALVRASIKNFRWHDLRHTWASWHVQNGTTLQELQQLGGWSNLEMVLRYAHLSSHHLRDASNRINVTISLHSILK